MERWDKLYRLRLFSPIEGELCPSDRMMEENISLTAYEMELYEELIRDSLKPKPGQIHIRTIQIIPAK